MMNDFVNMPYFLKSPSLHIVANVLSDPNCWFTFSDSGFNHLGKYESQWEGLSHILWKNKIHVPNHQPAFIVDLPLKNGDVPL